ISDRAVAGNAARELGAAVQTRAGHQTFDALVCVTQAFLEAHDGVAIGGEAEMPGLHDACMDRTHRNLMEALSLRRKESVAGFPLCGVRVREWRADVPTAVIKPRPAIASASGLQSE